MLAFVPMLFVSIGYQRAEQGRPGLRHDLHLGHPGVRAEDRLDGRLGHHRRRRPGDGQPRPGRRPVRVPAVQRRTASAANPTSGWVLLVGRRSGSCSMTYICYSRHRAVRAHPAGPARPSSWSCCVIFAVTALVKVVPATAPPAQSIDPSLVVVQPVRHRLVHRRSPRHAPDAVHLLGLGHRGLGQRGDQGPDKTPGRAAVISTVLLLVTYALVTLAAQSFAGVGDTGHRARQPGQLRRRALACSARRSSAAAGFGTRHGHLLILMVLTSAAASHADDDPADRPHHAVDGVYKAMPEPFARMHPRYLTPTRLDVCDGRRLDRCCTPA